MSAALQIPPVRVGWWKWSLPVGLAASAACGAGAQFYPAQFFPTYLVAFLFWLGISLGCLALAMLHHLTGGGWGVAIRRILEAGYSPLPLMAMLFAPLAWGLSTLYPWARPDEVAANVALQHKARYLNVEAFLGRSVGYFAVWIVLGLALNAWSAGADSAHEARRREALSMLSGPGLVLWCLTVTFAAVDWAMSLDAAWYSSMYGVLFIAGFGVSGLSLAIVAAILLRNRSPWSECFTVSRQHDLGNLLLAFVLFWSYVSFMQFLIVWSGNLPEEVTWYLRRGRGGWGAAVIGLMILHFLAPFLLLLSRETKRQSRRLFAVAMLLLAMRWVDLAWLVLPTFYPELLTTGGDSPGPPFWPAQLGAVWLLMAALAIGGLWLAVFSWRLSVRARLPVFDPSEAGEVAHESV